VRNPASSCARPGTERSQSPSAGGRSDIRPAQRVGTRDTRADRFEGRADVTGKSDFSPEEWKTVLEGPPSAGLMVAAAQRGGTFRESFSIAKSYAEARKHAGESQLLDEITATKPEIDHTRFHSGDELKQHCLENLRQSLGALEGKATAEEIAEYKEFVK